MEPNPAELLAYLADLGWSDLYLAAPPVPAARQGARSGANLPSSELSVAPSPPPVRPAAGVLAELAALAAQVEGCRACKLCTTRHRTVFASGDPGARLMLVGEGPGAEEDRQGLPFVGAAGELLNKILEAIGCRRDEVYVANIVKCRPPGNRDPEPDEIRACRGYLDRQIDLVRPAVLVALGRMAAQALLGSASSLTRLRGDWHEVRGIPVRVTYHPAALLRNPAWKRPTWEDMQLVRDRLRAGTATAGPAAEEND